MVYAIIQNSNGSFSVVEEGFTDKPTAIKRWHHICESMWAAGDVVYAVVKLVDENLDGVEGSKYTDVINRRPAPEPEPQGA